jgi:flagellar secretion chaperone FliS
MIKNAKPNPIAQSKLRVKARRAQPSVPEESFAAGRVLQASQASSVYRRVAVVVPPVVAVVRLFDGAIIYLRRAIEAIEAKRLEEGHNHVTRATAILRGLKYHLDFDKGGVLADHLSRTYTRLILSTLRAFGRPDVVASYKKIIVALTDLRDAWASVARTPNMSGENESGGAVKTAAG